jgi:hypothetical protein
LGGAGGLAIALKSTGHHTICSVEMFVGLSVYCLNLVELTARFTGNANWRWFPLGTAANLLKSQKAQKRPKIFL